MKCILWETYYITKSCNVSVTKDLPDNAFDKICSILEEYMKNDFEFKKSVPSVGVVRYYVKTINYVLVLDCDSRVLSLTPTDSDGYVEVIDMLGFASRLCKKSQCISDNIELDSRVRVYSEELEDGYIEGILTFINNDVINVLENVSNIDKGCAVFTAKVCVINKNDIQYIKEIETIKSLAL